MKPHTVQENTRYAATGLRCVVARDASCLASALPAWQQDYLQISPGPFAGAVTQVSLGAVQVFRERMNRAVDQQGHVRAGKFALGIPLSLRGQGYWCGQALEHVDSLFVLRPGTELKFRTPECSDIYGACLDTAAFEQYAFDDGCDYRRLLTRMQPVSPGAAATCSALRQGFEHCFSALASDSQALHAQAARKQLEFDMLHLLLGTVAALPASNTSYPGQFIHRHLVDSAREYILANKGQALTVADLCEGLRTSHRALHYAFRKVLGITPVSYLRYLRLHGVRAELIAAEDAVLIREVAARWGFWHMGMFGVYYKALFGQPPSATRKHHATP